MGGWCMNFHGKGAWRLSGIAGNLAHLEAFRLGSDRRIKKPRSLEKSPMQGARLTALMYTIVRWDWTLPRWRGHNLTIICRGRPHLVANPKRWNG